MEKMCRRTSHAPFRKIVLDFDAFKDTVQKKYVCAEDALYVAADTLALTNHQCGMDAQHVEVLPQSGRTVLYFTVPQTEITEPAFLRFSGSIPSLQSFGEEMRLIFYNSGGKSKGIPCHSGGGCCRCTLPIPCYCTLFALQSESHCIPHIDHNQITTLRSAFHKRFGDTAYAVHFGRHVYHENLSLIHSLFFEDIDAIFSNYFGI